MSTTTAKRYLIIRHDGKWAVKSGPQYSPCLYLGRDGMWGQEDSFFMERRIGHHTHSVVAYYLFDSEQEAMDAAEEAGEPELV